MEGAKNCNASSFESQMQNLGDPVQTLREYDGSKSSTLRKDFL